MFYNRFFNNFFIISIEELRFIIFLSFNTKSTNAFQIRAKFVSKVVISAVSTSFNYFGSITFGMGNSNMKASLF